MVLKLLSKIFKKKENLDKQNYRPVSVRFHNTLNHNILIANLRAYGFEADGLRYVKRYLMNREQKVSVNKNFSEWERITKGVLKRPFSFGFKLLLELTMLMTVQFRGNLKKD